MGGGGDGGNPKRRNEKNVCENVAGHTKRNTKEKERKTGNSSRSKRQALHVKHGVWCRDVSVVCGVGQPIHPAVFLLKRMWGLCFSLFSVCLCLSRGVKSFG